MRPLPKSAPQRKSERPSDALANVFAIPAAPLLPKEVAPDDLAPGPPLAQKDDGQITIVTSEASTEVSLDELDPGVVEDMQEAADTQASESPKAVDSQGRAYDPGLTGVQDGMFVGFTNDAPPPAKSSGGSSASAPMAEVERNGIVTELGKLGLTFRPGILISNNDMRSYHRLLVERKWIWTDDPPKLRRKLIHLFHAVFPDEIDSSLPTFERENAQKLAAELLKILRGRDLTALAKELKRTMPDLSPPKTPPPLPTTPDKEK